MWGDWNTSLGWFYPSWEEATDDDITVCGAGIEWLIYSQES